MKYIKYYLMILSIGLLISSCSEIEDEIATPTEIKVHGSEALIKSSPAFHGRQLVNGKMESCKQCHSADYSGGTAKVNCGTSQCHPGMGVHVGKDIMNIGSNKFHGRFIASTTWNMEQCRQCHGKNYSGGIASSSCNTCHTNAGGPEACNTCHGDFKDRVRVAPPRALNNAVETTDPGVGAHTLHLSGIDIAQNVSCSECHKVPASFDAAGHIDQTAKAEVIFGSFASSGAGKPVYNHTDYKCDNTYCHGSFEFSKANSLYEFAYVADKITGNNFKPVWNKVDGSQAKCGTCHGLPPTGHMASELRSCATCHQGVVDSKGNIIDAKKHIDGKINVFGN